MKSNKILQLIVIVLSLLLSKESLAQTISNAEAVSWAEEKGNLLLSTFSEKNIDKKYAALDEIFLKHIDLDYVSKFVVGKYWRTMTPAQKIRYQDLFKRYSLGQYKNFPLDFAEKIKFKVTQASNDKEYTIVSALIDLGLEENGVNKNILVEFRMHRTVKGIQIVDIKIAESSLILSYRNRFYEMIANNDNDIEWFLEDLEMLTVSAEKNTQNILINRRDNY